MTPSRKAEENRTPIGFDRLFSANAAENPSPIPTGIPFAIFLALSKNSTVKTAQHPTAKSFALDFCADDAAFVARQGR